FLENSLEKRCRDRAVDPDLDKKVKAVPFSSTGTGACDRPIQKTKDAKAVTMGGKKLAPCIVIQLVKVEYEGNMSLNVYDTECFFVVRSGWWGVVVCDNHEGK
ncbi:hypothetical protein Tco_0430435, partial [Tanacetum coccineum]